jgi:hypothetical protein
MKLPVIILFLALVAPPIGATQTNTKSQKAWRPFYTSLRAAVRKRDQAALMKLMSNDFYYLSSGGDENGNQDTRDEAFEFWKTSSTDVWKEMDKVFAKEAVTKTSMPELGSGAPSRIAPPIANNAKAIKDRAFDWFAIFEFKDGRWYWTAFATCCD